MLVIALSGAQLGSLFSRTSNVESLTEALVDDLAAFFSVNESRVLVAPALVNSSMMQVNASILNLTSDVLRWAIAGKDIPLNDSLGVYGVLTGSHDLITISQDVVLLAPPTQQPGDDNSDEDKWVTAVAIVVLGIVVVLLVSAFILVQRRRSQSSGGIRFAQYIELITQLTPSPAPDDVLALDVAPDSSRGRGVAQPVQRRKPAHVTFDGI